MKKEQRNTIFSPGDTCWCVAQADALALIVDAADYFRALRDVMKSAQHELLLIGWDFDFEIEMLPGESDAEGCAPDGLPNRLGPFIDEVVERASGLKVYILKWNGAALVAPGRILPTLRLRTFGCDRIHFALDGHHPFGACHHQKIVVADNSFAFCGGIDATEYRWDTSDHAPDDPRRVLKDGSLAPPWHDATAAVSGPAAASLAELSRQRWQRATGETLEVPRTSQALVWPDTLSVTTTDIDVAIARTEPPYDEEPLINEIEELYLAAIKSARKQIYIESQYFAAESICKALGARLREPDGPEIVVINPKTAQSEFEDDAMNVIRGRMIRRLEKINHTSRFRIFYPVNSAEEAIYIHAKILIVDDQVLRIGSSNVDDRSLGFDTECDLAFEEPDGGKGVIAQFRRRLLAEHLDTSIDEVASTESDTGSMIRMIDALNAVDGRGLRKIVPRAEGIRGKILANTRLLDQRYRPGQPSSSGQGIRPRHIAIAAAASGVVLAGWSLWKRWKRR